MSDARTEMLARIRAALHDAAPPPALARSYQQTDDRERAVILEELVERLRDYKTQVSRVAHEDLASAIATAAARYGIAQLAVPSTVPAAWLPAGITVRRDDPLLTHGELDSCDGVLTGCALAVAQTGTIILDGGARQGRRVLSLVPDVHLCVVDSHQVVGSVPEGIAHLADHPTRPITFISGPSATSDIELNRVEGVHGPRTLHIFLT